MGDEQGNHDHQKWVYEQNRAVAERAHDTVTDFVNRTNESAINTGNQALRALIIINGGAAVTVLAFVGHLVGDKRINLIDRLSDLTSPLLWFAAGVALATLGIGLAYITNYAYAAAASGMQKVYDPPYLRETASTKRWRRFGVWMQIGAVVVALLSLGFFVYGMVDIRHSINFLHQTPEPKESQKHLTP